MKNILVPLGISDRAPFTLKYALTVAAYFDSTVYVVDAYPTHVNPIGMTNVKARLDEENHLRIKKLVSEVGTQYKKIKIVKSEQDLLGTIKKLNQTIGLDLVVVAPLNNDFDDKVFLGRIAGSIIKRSDVPVLVAPLKGAFIPPKKMLMAFKTGEVKNLNTLKVLMHFQDTFQARLKLLLVKVPGFANKNHQIDDALTMRADKMIFSVNATVYQGVLEHFQSSKPDMLVVFKRERGFFEKLWETDLIFKADFYCTVPLLVLKNID